MKEDSLNRSKHSEDFSERIAGLSPSKRALLERRLNKNKETSVNVGTLLPRQGSENVPLSFAQHRLWFLDKYEPNNSAYHISNVFQLKGTVNVTALKEAFKTIVDRHEVLRTTFDSIDGKPVQVVQENHGVELPIIDISNVSPDDKDAEVQALLSDEVQKTFNFSSDVMVRSTLIKLNPEEHLLLIVIHHIASDGWSMGILWQELSVLYNAYCVGNPSPLPDLPIQYADFAVWQRERLQGEGMENQLSYWKTCLKGAPGILELPTDHPRPSIQTYKGAQESFTLPRDLISSLKNLCKLERVTLFMIFLSAFKVLLYRYTDQEDILVGTPIANRSQTEIEGLIGFFVNTLVLRTDMSGNPTFRDLLKKVRNVCLDAYAHQDLPFERLVEELQPQRDMSHSPLFQVMFVLQNAPRQTLELSNLTLNPFQFGNDTSKFDLNLTIIENEELFSGQIEYNTDLFDQATMKRMATHFKVLVEGIVSNPDQILSALPLLTQAEQRQLLVGWNDTEADYPKDQCLHELFEAQVERTPDVVAVVLEDQQLTYRELNTRANQLAHYLRKQGVGPEVLVGICVERSLEMVIGLLGILKAGGAYVPLDPGNPQERLAFMIEDAQIPVLLTQENLDLQLPKVQNPQSPIPNPNIVCQDTDRDVISQQSDDNPVCLATPDNIAYVIYTSGSTGKPKGTIINHQSVVNYLCWCTNAYAVAGGYGAPVNSSIGFDATITSLFSPLLVGARIVLLPDKQEIEALCAALSFNLNFSLVKITPAHLDMLNKLLNPKKSKEQTRALIIGGEALHWRHLSFWESYAPDTRIINEYGPTETVVGCCVYDARGRTSQPGTVPIGRPIANMQLYILDSYLQPVPIGVPGELCIGGAGLARGYLNRPNLTAEKFIPNPFSKEPGSRMYKTGDQARYLPDGNIEFLGRIDNQVKVRGFRIELGEIEAVLNQHPAVQETVAVVREDLPGDKRLAAYVVSNSKEATSNTELRRFLKAKLPDYMVPSSFVMLGELPLTSNGKVDRKALPAPDQTRPELDETFVGPRTLVEETLAGIWVEVLRVERIGIHDNFFDLGGHSLIATQVMSKLRDAFNVDLPLRILFESPTVAGMSQEINRRQLELAKPERTILHRDNHSAPLSFAQQRLWFLDKYNPNSFMYNISTVYQLKGVLDVTALGQAIAAIIERHEVLQTTFPSVDGNAVQRVSKNNPLDILKVIDLSDLPDSDQERKVHESIRKETQRPFDLATDRMLRATMLQLDPETQVLLLVIHHIAFDGWSGEIFHRELSTLYEAFLNQKQPQLPNLTIQYADYSAWQHSWLSGDVLQSELSYWRKQLDGVPPCLEVPIDSPRPANQTFRGRRHPVRLSGSLTQSLKKLSSQEGSTLFMTLLAAFQTLLYRHTGQDDLIVGIPIAGRDKTETEALIGFFINTLAIRTVFPDKLRFNELLQEVRETALEAYAHQAFPFEKLVQDLQLDRDPSRPPLVQVMFAFQNTPKRDLMLPGLTVSEMEFDSGMVRFDLEFFMWEEQDKLRGSFVYNADLFNADTVERMGRHFQTLLEGIAANPQQRISDLPLLSEVEEHQLRVEWNETNTTYPQDLCIHQLFDIQAEKTPDAVALEFGEENLSYRELSCRSNQLAHYLRSEGIGPDVLVGICMERSLEMIIGMLGILKAGGVYVPLDPSYPEERLAYMLEETGTPVLLTQKLLLPRMPNQEGKIFCLDSDWESIAYLSETSPSFEMTSDNLAYVIYTSGSTGHPKGTCVPHRAINRLVFNTNYITLTPSDRIAQASNSSFDAATFEIWGALLNGACLVGMTTDELLSPQEFSVTIREKRITTLFLTTALFNQLAAYAPQVFSSLNHLLFGGETVDPKWVREVVKHGAPDRLVHVYGPTENTTFSTWYLVENVSEEDTTIPIGKPVSNTQCYIFDKHMQMVPVGISGELCLGGDGLAQGYYKRPELTKAKFVPNPFEETSVSNLYKTGDLVRYLPDGNIEFLGRIDDQVKLRGFRIELSEIETIMSQHSCAANVAVIMREDRPGDKKLVAYFVPKEPLEYDIADLRTFLSKKLPGYMIPQHFVALEKFPITANGKVDRKAFPVPQASFSHEQGFVAPRTEIEAKLVEIWQELIGINRISVNENFFVIGGHSLLAVRLFSKLSHLFEIDLPLATLFETPTIEGLAQRVEASIKKTSRIKRIFKIFQKTPILEITAPDKGAYTHLVAIQPNGNRPPFFCMHAVGGNVLQYYYFVDELGSDQPLYGLQSLGLDGVSEPYKDIETMAVNYIKEIRQVQPYGPYFVGGGSMGGLIALEVAQQLKQDGEEIALLAMFDTFAPSYFDTEGYKPRKLFSKNWIGNFLPNHIQELRKQSLKGQIIYGYNRISGLIRHRFKFFVCFFYHRIRRPLPHSIRYWYVENKNRRPAFVYTPKTYDGNLTLFSDSRNAGVEEKDMEKGWREFISGDIEVVGIPAKHSEFIEDPILAKKLKICLEGAQQNIK